MTRHSSSISLLETSDPDWCHVTLWKPLSSINGVVPPPSLPCAVSIPPGGISMSQSCTGTFQSQCCLFNSCCLKADGSRQRARMLSLITDSWGLFSCAAVSALKSYKATSWWDTVSHVDSKHRAALSSHHFPAQSPLSPLMRLPSGTEWVLSFFTTLKLWFFLCLFHIHLHRWKQRTGVHSLFAHSRLVLKSTTVEINRVKVLALCITLYSLCVILCVCLLICGCYMSSIHI